MSEQLIKALVNEGARIMDALVVKSDPSLDRNQEIHDVEQWKAKARAALSTHHAAPGAPQQVEDVIPPRPLGYNDASTDPTSPLQRWGKPRHEGAKLLLQPIADGYWTPWHIANDMLREAQRAAATAPAGGVTPELKGVLDRLDSKELAEWVNRGMALAENVAMFVQADCSLRASQARDTLRAHLFSVQPTAERAAAPDQGTESRQSRYRAALEEIAAMEYDRWSNGARAKEIAQRMLDAGVTPTAAEVVDYCARHGVSPAKAKEALATAARAAEPEPWVPYLLDRADGVRGHYCIARMTDKGIRETWSPKRESWGAFSDTVFVLGKTLPTGTSKEGGEHGA